MNKNKENKRYSKIFIQQVVDATGEIDVLQGEVGAQIGGDSVFGLPVYLSLAKAGGTAYQLKGKTQIDRQTPYVGAVFGGVGVEVKVAMGNAKAYAGFDKNSVGVAAKASLIEGEVSPIIGIPFTDTDIKFTFGASGGSVGGEARIGKETILDLRFIIGVKLGVTIE
ncbi:hypothetical protein [Aquibacillus rhizosphaerae]|uniref:Uncharacterized protein n=1 Tax=Aquibacillus rhizosphaerae TaxID=3051431 RepID=A0ABT7LC44_9BACI|nr:hypothetical protein [Aquibacillus sp. LR5S19]MDL4842136.1 hypothetical protein [Aquibacillus sp. LR5S19]